MRCRTDLHIDLGGRVVAVLIDNAGFSIDELLDRFITPPWNTISIFVELPACVIESMSDFVTDDHADA